VLFLGRVVSRRDPVPPSRLCISFFCSKTILYYIKLKILISGCLNLVFFKIRAILTENQYLQEGFPEFVVLLFWRTILRR
jgi:hypothetical protein